MERIKIAGLVVEIEPKSPGVYDVGLILPVFGKKSATASVAEVRAMRDAIDRVLTGAPAAASAPTAASRPPATGYRR